MKRFECVTSVRKSFSALGSLLLTLLCITATQADEVTLPLGSDLQNQSDVYTVELVLFAQPNFSLAEEYWPNEQPAPDYLGSTVPRPHDGAPLSTGEVLARSNFALTGEVSRLNRNGYEVLYHNSWVQTFKPNTNTTVRVGSPTGLFEGTVRIERKRFLHVYPDINYYLSAGPEQVAPVVKMAESRRMRSAELHYIDHPALGMLVLFRPVKSS